MARESFLPFAASAPCSSPTNCVIYSPAGRYHALFMERVFADVYSVAALILAHNRLVETILIQITCTHSSRHRCKKDAVIAHTGSRGADSGRSAPGGLRDNRTRSVPEPDARPAIYGDPFWMFNAKTVFLTFGYSPQPLVSAVAPKSKRPSKI